MKHNETAIVRDGHLESLLHNSVTASHFKIKNTANASRGTKGALAVAPAHLAISAGKQSVAETLAGTYLELISLQGVHSGANAVSGNFSLGASGFLCREGQRVQPVRGVTVAGNFYEMLTEIAAISDQVSADHGRTFFAPHLLRKAEMGSQTQHVLRRYGNGWKRAVNMIFKTSNRLGI